MEHLSDAVSTDDVFTDDELAELAMQADPTERLEPGAVAVPGSVPADDGPLPGWYMPSPTRVVHSRGRRTVTLVVVGSFLLINALGLCATYGFLEIA